MKTTSIFTLLLIAVSSALFAQKTTVYKQKGYQLTFTNQDKTFDSAEQDRLVKTFFTVYPLLAKEYNPATLKAVTMIIDTSYKGVAATDDGIVHINPEWLHKHPEDIDVVTHEVMHIVQDYKGYGPGWLTEGIADYARYKFGVNNTAANWKLPDYKPTQNYDNAYRITARFLLWLETKVKPGIVKVLDKQMRDHTLTDNTWKTLTGKTLEELWKDYSQNPAI
jgi:hypothetical protein